MNEICRICLNSGIKLIPIFKRNGKIAKEIFLITGIVITELKNEPALICDVCCDKLFIAIQFRKVSILSDHYFKRSIKMKECWQEELNLMLNKNPVVIESGENVKCETFSFSNYEENNFSDDDKFTVESSSDVEEIVEKKVKKDLIKCPHCKAQFSKRYLKNHIRLKHEHKPDAGHGYLCDYCDKKFGIKSSLERHIKRCHHQINPSKRPPAEAKTKKKQTNIFDNKQEFICSVCAKIFKSRSSLSQHEKTHRIVLPQEYFYCDHCGNKFKQKYLLKVHIVNRHIRKIRFQCNQCDKNYAKKYFLKIHIKVHHDNILDYKCEYCNRLFGKKEFLVSHVRTHTGERPFECNICQKRFMYQTDWRRHVWNHTGKRPIKCQHCDQGFMKNAELQNHMKRNHNNL